MAGRVMGEMNILVLRTNSCAPDPRVEKEVNSLISNPAYSVKILCWDRDGRKGTFQELLTVSNGVVQIRRFGIPASWGGGMKANFFPMLKFEWKLFWWLLIHGKEYIISEGRAAHREVQRKILFAAIHSCVALRRGIGQCISTA